MEVDDKAVLDACGVSYLNILHQEVALQVIVPLEVVLNKLALLDLESVVALEKRGIDPLVVLKKQVLRYERFLKDEEVQTTLSEKLVVLERRLENLHLDR